MAKLEKYGLGLKGLKAACTRTKNCRPYFGGYGVYYDRRNDEILTTYYRNEDTYRCNKYSDKDHQYLLHHGAHDYAEDRGRCPRLYGAYPHPHAAAPCPGSLQYARPGLVRGRRC